VPSLSPEPQPPSLYTVHAPLGVARAACSTHSVPPVGVAGLNALPWSPAVHRHYPPAFRAIVRLLLLCGTRPPLCLLPDGVLLLVLEQLARCLFWETPPIALDEGAEVAFGPQRGASSAREAPAGGGAAGGGGGAGGAAAGGDGSDERGGRQPVKYVERLNRHVPVRQPRRRVHQHSYFAGKSEAHAAGADDARGADAGGGAEG
jgi:hypothetical protein